MLIRKLSQSWSLLLLLAFTASDQVLSVLGDNSSSGELELPASRSTVELTYHGDELACTDLVEEGSDFCEDFEDYEGDDDCEENEKAERDCCACGGGKEEQFPRVPAALDMEILRINEDVTATSTFMETQECLDSEGMTKRLPLSDKLPDRIRMISSLDEDIDSIVKHICNVNAEPLQKRILELGGDAIFEDAVQLKKGNSLITGRQGMINKFKPGTTMIRFIFSSDKMDVVYHLPWFDDWLPMLQETVLQPLGIPVNRILRMMVANMPEGSSINFHSDSNQYARKAHRVHVPIITHPNIFFLSKIASTQEILRIKSGMGEVYEFNNRIPHAVRNTGGTRVHLIIDWIEDVLTSEGDLRYSLVKVPRGQECDSRRQYLDCQPATMNIESDGHDAGESETTVDKHPKCAYWADHGECEVNPDYMLVSCAAACKNKQESKGKATDHESKEENIILGQTSYEKASKPLHGLFQMLKLNATTDDL